ncbi:MAG TPA: hypothetical protein VN366_02290 [Feifaniaceae bacterium]|nr:hypothetical protein [Feifaniaceae bacterium]
MAVKSDYRVTGMSTAEVRELQRNLGVTPDGAWGKQSQAALDKLYGANADPLKIFKGSGNGSGSAAGQSGAGASSAAKQYGQLSNGYTGSYYTKNGDNYTDYGALLRTDGFYYPAGAKISPNGMYVDVGNGWEFAQTGSLAGIKPGTRIDFFSGGPRGESDPEPAAPEPEPNADQPKSEWELYLERELKRYEEEWLSGYVE